MKKVRILRFLASVAAGAVVTAAAFAQWHPQKSNTDASLLGLSIVNGNVVWVSGTGGTVGAEKLDSRDVYAIDGETAYLLSIGKGSESRIYKTTDAGKNWLLEYTEQNPKAFLDS